MSSVEVAQQVRYDRAVPKRTAINGLSAFGALALVQTSVSFCCIGGSRWTATELALCFDAVHPHATHAAGI